MHEQRWAACTSIVAHENVSQRAGDRKSPQESSLYKSLKVTEVEKTIHCSEEITRTYPSYITHIFNVFYLNHWNNNEEPFSHIIITKKERKQFLEVYIKFINFDFCTHPTNVVYI